MKINLVSVSIMEVLYDYGLNLWSSTRVLDIYTHFTCKSKRSFIIEEVGVVIAEAILSLKKSQKIIISS